MYVDQLSPSTALLSVLTAWPAAQVTASSRATSPTEFTADDILYSIIRITLVPNIFPCPASSSVVLFILCDVLTFMSEGEVTSVIIWVRYSIDQPLFHAFPFELCEGGTT